MLDYGIIGNCRTCALISKKASVEWMCYPDFDSPSIFAKLLDEKKGGSLQIRPVGKYKISQRYLPHTAILETVFESEKDSFKVLDFFPRYRKLVSKRKDKLMRQNRMIRIIKPITGKPRIRVIYDPKPNYALKECDLVEENGNLLCAGTEVSLISNLPYQAIIRQDIVELDKTKYLVVGKKDHTEDFNVKRCLILLNSTKKYWEKWVGSLILPEMNRDLIICSAITLKLLTFSPTGAIVAAPT
ncbi:MAG: trehalase-like domain-containing protein, partial [Candidatus Woesearchaeota archaeon]